jgi:MFS family permease
VSFIGRQKHNYRVAITRSATNSFLLNLTAQYDSIYTVALGAGSVELGTINSIGNGIGALISTPVGWLVDRYGMKRFYLLGMALLAGSALAYALAGGWYAVAAAVILYSVSMRLTSTGCSVISADSVANEDRATAQNTCVTLASIASLFAPMIAAQLVTFSGGLTQAGIRPLYLVRFGGYVLILAFVAGQLRNPVWKQSGAAGRRGFMSGFGELFQSKKPLRRWLAVMSLTWLPMAMTGPFVQLYAHQAKGADQYLLGIMATATVVARIAFGIPLGRLADRIGRKKVIYMLTPLWYGSFLLLILSRSPAMLVLAGGLQVFYLIVSGVTSAMTIELVPIEQMGKWSGLLGLVRGLVTIPAPTIAGLVWDRLDPAYVFVVPLVIDLVVKLPLLATIPETLEQ